MHAQFPLTRYIRIHACTHVWETRKLTVHTQHRRELQGDENESEVGLNCIESVGSILLVYERSRVAGIFRRYTADINYAVKRKRKNI